MPASALATIGSASLLAAAVSQEADADAALDRFLAAADRAEAEGIAAELADLDLDFDSVYARLARGRAYSPDVPRGLTLKTRRSHGLDHHYMYLVPEAYDPTRPVPVRFELHGGMGHPEWERCDGSWNAAYAAIDPYRDGPIFVMPAGWWDSMWWEASQVDNFHAILDEVKRTFNVDENRVIMVGGSDGAIGAWFYAFRDATPWAGYAGWVGFPARLTNREMRADGQMHLSNLDGQRFFLVNGVHDRIVDIGVTRSYIELFRVRGEAILDYREHADDGHALQLSADEERDFWKFLQGTRRDPLPDRLTWSTERVDRYARRSWLLITELERDHPVDESNVLPRIWGHNVPRTKPPEPRPWGRVELTREDNRVTATTVGVARFELLLSPSEFDLDEPVRVVVDGNEVFDDVVPRDLDVLLRWAARDDDRSMLFAAQLEIVVP